MECFKALEDAGAEISYRVVLAYIEIDFHPSAEAQASRAQESAYAEGLVAQARECWEASRDRQSGHDLTQTTPHLLAWLDFNGALTGAEKQDVLTQHTDLNGSLAAPFARAMEMASQCKANASSGIATPSAAKPPVA